MPLSSFCWRGRNKHDKEQTTEKGFKKFRKNWKVRKFGRSEKARILKRTQFDESNQTQFEGLNRT